MPSLLMLCPGQLIVEARIIRALAAPALGLLECNETLNLALRLVGQLLELLHEVDVPRRNGLLGDVFEELADADLELGEDAEEGVEAYAVLPLLHAGEVRLLDPQALRQLHLGQLVLL